MKFYFSIDVDYLRGSEIAIPELCEFSRENGLQTSFFVTGLFAQEYTGVIRSIASKGYEIGIHGWDHGANDSKEDFGRDPYDEQLKRIQKATEAVQIATGRRPVLHRSPNLWVCESTLRALEHEGYKLDSSVPARRLLGRIRSLSYFSAPLNPYHPSVENLGRRGTSSILEVPPTAFFMPINLSSLRMFGLRNLKPIIRLARRASDVFVFYGHPAEYLDFKELSFDGPVVQRHAKGIGRQNYGLTRQFINYIYSLGYEPGRLSDLIE